MKQLKAYQEFNIYGIDPDVYAPAVPTFLASCWYYARTPGAETAERLRRIIRRRLKLDVTVTCTYERNKDARDAV